MRKQKERVKCVICSAPVSSRNCDRAVFGARNPTSTVVFPAPGTGIAFPTEKEYQKHKELTYEKELEDRLRAKGWVL